MTFDEREQARHLALADHFTRADQQYRAIGVLEELRLFASTPEIRAWAGLRIAVAYHLASQHDAAVGAYDAVLTDATLAPDLRALAAVQRASVRADQELADPGHVALPDLLAELAPQASSADAAGAHAAFLRARVAAVAGDRAALRDALAAARTGCAPAKSTPESATPGDVVAKSTPVSVSVSVSVSVGVPCERVELLERSLRGKPARRRSPLLGMTMSAVVPGLGSVYAGHPVDGLYYGGLTALTALGAWNVYEGERALSDQRAAFWGLATTAGLFYISGLLHARVAASRFNAVERHRWLRRIWDDTAAPLPLADLPPPR